jgi:2-keto-4-pentenoate hydratase/2-oxohepta-3-ene-1,7-dioic acid hydratase in catechol pathway
MKIICIGRNYVDHVAELKNEMPSEPMVFLKPDSALILNNRPFFYPEFSNDIHHELELVVRINRLGKHIQRKFAHKYYDQVGLGIDFTARDIQSKCKEKGLPWEKAKAFDGSAPLSRLNEIKNKDLSGLNYKLLVNGELKQEGHPGLMMFPIDQIIAYVSSFMTLKIGDLIYTGTPAGVGPVKIGDQLEAYLGDEKLLDFRVK